MLQRILLALCVIGMGVIGNLSPTYAAPHRDSVPQSRLDRLAKAANVTLWFRYPEREDDDYFTNYLSDADMELIHNLGIRTVRLAIAPQYIYKRGVTTPNAEMLAYYDKAIERFIDHDIAVMVDIHDEDKDKSEIDKDYLPGYLKFWAVLAKHFSERDPEMLFIDAYNEPYFWDIVDDWNAYQGRLIEVIRQAAPEHTIIATGARYSSIDGLLMLGKPYDDPNVVYSFNFYEPMTFTHQGAPWVDLGLLTKIPYPADSDRCATALKGIFKAELKSIVQDYCNEGWNAEKIDARIKEAADWAQENNVHLMIKEFGVYCPTVLPADRLQWFADVMTAVHKYNIGWAIWSYEECFGLSRRVEDDKIQIDNGVAGALGLTVPTQ
jgi:endoglucanase